MNKSDERLLEYITTGNFKHPDDMDISVFGEYGGFHDKCPFCEEKNSSKNPLTVVLNERNLLGKTIIRTEKTFLCDHHKTVHEKFKDVKIHDSSILNPRLRHFLLTEELPDDSLYYSEDHEFEHQCVFCSRDLHMNCATLQIEQGKFDVITAPVKVCNKCSDLVDSNEAAYTGHCQSKIAADTCRICNQRYAISLSEERTRTLNETLGKHICNDCLYSEYNIVNQPRFEELQCQECEEKSYVDKTLSLEVQIYKCAKHTKEENEDLILYSVGDNDEISIEIIKLFDKWVYTGYDTITRRVLFNSEITSPGGFKKEEDAMYGASFKALEILDKMYKQTKLFP